VFDITIAHSLKNLVLSQKNLRPSYRPKLATGLTLHLLHALPVAALAIPANSAARASYAKSTKHIYQLPLSLFALTQMRRCI